MDAMTPDPRFAADHHLAKRIVGGSQHHWHEFVERYTPLIRSVIRRYIHDDDDLGTVWTTVLERLHGGLLEQYRGQPTLATWLFYVARSEACDHLRRIRGRRRLPERLEGSSELLVAVYREIVLEGRGPAEITHRLRTRGLLEADRSLAEVVAELEDLLGNGTLQQVTLDLQADEMSMASDPVQQFLDHAVAEAAASTPQHDPSHIEYAEDSRRTLQKILAIVEGLPETERRVVKLRYRRGWSARTDRRQALHLQDQREIYTISERAIRSIRKLLGLTVLTTIFVFFVGAG